MAKQSKLSLSSINKQHSSEFNTLKRVTLKNGDYVDVVQKFKRTSIQKFLLDYQDILEQLKQRNDVNWEVAKDVTFVYYMLLLKYFTSLGDTIPLDIEKMIVICEKLIDLDLLDEILGHILEEEIKKVSDMIENMSKNANMIGNQVGELFVQAGLNEIDKKDKENEYEVV